MKNFWEKLNRPIFALAPMEDVTDTVFRRIVASAARPDVFFTEFTSVDGLLSKKGFEKVAKRLIFTEEERPIVAQIWGNDPEKFREVAKMLKKMGFDGIDINMGCPVPDLVKKFCGGGAIRNPELAAEIIAATKEGAGGLPVSVKTRIGVKEIITEEWVEHLLKQDIAALTIHGRTVKEMSKVPAHWDEIKKTVEIRDRLKVKTLILGNGDVISAEDALEKIVETGVDGVMIGRGVFKDYWIFNKQSFRSRDKKKERYQPTLDEKLKLLLRHAEMFDEVWGETKNFALLRKFFKSYVAEFLGASDLREQLVQTNSVEEVRTLLKPYLS